MAPGSATGDTVVVQGMVELSTVVASVPAMFQAFDDPWRGISILQVLASRVPFVFEWQKEKKNHTKFYYLLNIGAHRSFHMTATNNSKIDGNDI